jgi:hypothetical protein
MPDRLLKWGLLAITLLLLGSWGTSYKWSPQLSLNAPGNIRGAWISKGTVFFYRVNGNWLMSGRLLFRNVWFDIAPAGSISEGLAPCRFVGFLWELGSNEKAIGIPIWFLMLPVLFAWWFLRRRGRIRRAFPVEISHFSSEP